MNWKLETERLFLREFVKSDAKYIYELNAVREQIEFTGDVAFESVGAAEIFLENYSDYKRNGYGRWACVTKDTKDWIGWCGLKKHNDFVDIGYRFFKEYWGKGYATEAAKASIDYGFEELGLSEIIGRAHADNAASIRVLEKIGLEFWKEDHVDSIGGSKIFKITKNNSM